MKKATKVILGVISAAILLFFIFGINKLWEDVDAGEIVVIQDPIDGELHVFRSSGLKKQGWGKVTHYKKSNTFWFSVERNKKGEIISDKSIGVKWNDGGHSNISGSVRYDLPTSDASMIDLHSRFGSQEAIEEQVIKVNIEKAVYLTGPLMTSKESYAERKNDLIFYIEDQASRGVYRTIQRQVKEVDPITNAEKNSIKVEIQMDAGGVPQRQEASPVHASGIKLYNTSINGMQYDKTVEDQIATQQQAIMQVQTAIAKSREAEQRALTVQKEGEADAAKAKWEQEVIKATMVTEAEAKRDQARLDLQTAELTKQRLILEGEGEAAKKRLAIQANGALEQKLAAYIETNRVWADAMSKFTGNIVPQIQTGGSGTANGGNGFNMMMEMIGVKTARDMALDLSNKK